MPDTRNPPIPENKQTRKQNSPQKLENHNLGYSSFLLDQYTSKRRLFIQIDYIAFRFKETKLFKMTQRLNVLFIKSRFAIEPKFLEKKKELRRRQGYIEADKNWGLETEKSDEINNNIPRLK